MSSTRQIGYYIQHFPYKERLNDTQYYKQYGHGGAEVAAYYLAVNMAKRGHEINIFTTSINHKDSIEKKGNMVIYRYAKNLGPVFTRAQYSFSDNS